MCTYSDRKKTAFGPALSPPRQTGKVYGRGALDWVLIVVWGLIVVVDRGETGPRDTTDLE